MKCTADEQTMEKRRLERLDRLNFFMRNARVPTNARRVMSLGCAHDLLTGFFRNSHWKTAWYCVKQAVSNSWMEFGITCQLIYYRRILRLTDEQVHERFRGTSI